MWTKIRSRKQKKNKILHRPKGKGKCNCIAVTEHHVTATVLKSRVKNKVGWSGTSVTCHMGSHSVTYYPTQVLSLIHI